MKKVLGRIWTGWKRFAHAFGRFQTAVILTITYFVVLAPVGLLFRVFGWDPLEGSARARNKSSNWKKLPEGRPDPQSLRRQS